MTLYGLIEKNCTFVATIYHNGVKGTWLGVFRKYIPRRKAPK